MFGFAGQLQPNSSCVHTAGILTARRVRPVLGLTCNAEVEAKQHRN